MMLCCQHHKEWHSLFLLSVLLCVVGLAPALVDAAFTTPVRSTIKKYNLMRLVDRSSSSSNSNNEDTTTTSRVIYRRIVTSEDDITIVAEDIQTYSFQIISLGYASIIPASSSTFEDDDNYNTKYYNSLQQREVVKSATDMIESDINEQIWEEFEDDSTQIPTGLSSLPWTSEYRAASRSAVKRKERREMMMKQEEEYAKRNRPRIWELSFISFNERVINNIIDNMDDHQNNRQQYKDEIQLELLQQILQEQSKRQYNKSDELYAIAPVSLVPLLVQERFGFVEVRQVPQLISMKMSLKNAASKLLLGGEENICLIRSREIL
jgi:hypothetical protein